MFHELTDAPAAIPGLMVDTPYFVQNKTVCPVVVEPSEAAPADRHAPGRTLWPGQGARFQLSGRQRLFAWTPNRADNGRIYVSANWLPD